MQETKEIRSFMDQKKRIVFLIKKISDFFGGDIASWLDDYTKQIILQNYLQLHILLFALEDINHRITRHP